MAPLEELWTSEPSHRDPDDRPAVSCCRYHTGDRQTVEVSFGSLNSITLTNRSRKPPPPPPSSTMSMTLEQFVKT